MLNLQSNRLGTAGAASLAAALRVNSSLQRLNLLHNEVRATQPQTCAWHTPCRARAAAAAARALSLTTACRAPAKPHRPPQVCDRGAEELADALRVNRGLKHLNLQYNALRAPAARALGARFECMRYRTLFTRAAAAARPPPSPQAFGSR